MNKKKRKSIKSGQKRKSKKKGFKPGKVCDRDVFENALQMSPTQLIRGEYRVEHELMESKRIILGEFREEEATKVKQAMGRII